MTRYSLERLISLKGSFTTELDPEVLRKSLTVEFKIGNHTFIVKYKTVTITSYSRMLLPLIGSKGLRKQPLMT